MKTVFLVRHAKSSWDYASLDDIERPLNDRGLRDAPFMAELLNKKIGSPDAIFTSPAVRAFTTASFFKKEMKVEGEDFHVRDAIYEAMPQTIVRFIQMLPENLGTVMLFGHNPTFTSVANLYTDRYIGNVPTCGIVQIESKVPNWTEFGKSETKVKALFFPKDYL